MDIFDLLNMVGGLALFLYGMRIMGNGLSQMAGGKLETVLEKLTTKKITAVLLGAGVTAIIQSSSATTVMVVGFVNSGIMKLQQAVGVIMGANIGTTITSWILSLTGIEGNAVWVKLLKPSSFSPVLAIVGVIIILAAKTGSKKKDIGEILIGFAILMFGMETMSGAVAGLADNPGFRNLMIAFQNPLFGLAIGAFITAIIQSSSASVGILQAFCATGAVSYSVAIPIIMGQNIGTCITSIISSIGANRNAKRAAMVHLFFNLIGTTVFMAGFYLLNAFINFAFLDKSASVLSIAIIHSLFNIGATLLLYPFSNQLVKLAEFVIRDKDKKESDSVDSKLSIDERFLDRPAFAIEICREKSREMAELTREAVLISMETLVEYDKDKAQKVAAIEKQVDKYEDMLGSYLVKLASKNISKEDSQSMSVILHSIADFERISDYSRELIKSSEEMHLKNITFTNPAKKEIETLGRAIKDITNLTINSFCNDDVEKAIDVEPLNKVIKDLVKTIKDNHIIRLQKGNCSIEMGFILEDVMVGLGRISEHCSNIAIEMITIFDNNYNTHGYLRGFSEKQLRDFNNEYERLIKCYPIEENNDIIAV